MLRLQNANLCNHFEVSEASTQNNFSAIFFIIVAFKLKNSFCCFNNVINCLCAD